MNCGVHLHRLWAACNYETASTGTRTVQRQGVCSRKICCVSVPHCDLRERVLCETAVFSDMCLCLLCLPVNEPINHGCFILLFILSAVSSHSLIVWCIVLEGTARNGWRVQPSLGCCVHNTRRLNCVPSSFFTCAQFCCNIYFTAVQVFESCVGECGVTSWLLSANWAFFRAPVVRVEVSAALMWSALWCCSTENTYRGVWTSWYLQSFVVLTAHSEMAVMLTLNQFRHSLETCGVFCRQVFNFQEQKKKNCQSYEQHFNVMRIFCTCACISMPY